MRIQLSNIKVGDEFIEIQDPRTWIKYRSVSTYNRGAIYARTICMSGKICTETEIIKISEIDNLNLHELSDTV